MFPGRSLEAGQPAQAGHRTDPDVMPGRHPGKGLKVLKRSKQRKTLGMLDRMARRAARYRQDLGSTERGPGTTSWKITTPLGELGRKSHTSDPELRIWFDELGDLSAGCGTFLVMMAQDDGPPRLGEIAGRMRGRDGRAGR